MALVSYDYASGSDNESEEEEESSDSKVILNGAHEDRNSSKEATQSLQEPNRNIESKSTANIDSPSTGNHLFSKLPESRRVIPQIIEENDKLEDFIPTVKTLKEKKKVQISIPSLKDFEEPSNGNEPLRKKIKQSQKSSGLLTMLPPVQSAPLSNTSFVPNAVKSKNILPKTSTTSATTSTTSKGLMPHSVRKKMEAKKAAATAKSKKGSDSETDDEDLPIPDTFDDQMWEKVCGRPKAPAVVEVDQTQPNVEPEQFTIAPEPEKPYDGLDNQAFKELVGKVKKPLGNIKLIDIHEDEILSDKETWMMKSLTDPEMAPKSKIDDPVDPTRKRKHHITYLAQQAKANEQELKSAWGVSRNNRMMSRSKYGF